MSYFKSDLQREMSVSSVIDEFAVTKSRITKVFSLNNDHPPLCRAIMITWIAIICPTNLSLKNRGHYFFIFSIAKSMFLQTFNRDPFSWESNSVSFLKRFNTWIKVNGGLIYRWILTSSIKYSKKNALEIWLLEKADNGAASLSQREIH